uniref:Reverse transcriptase domain-containing protein n=1 Tax=Ananas comosus var. bracteatus TaxID=296719 RepID=A0A6V7NQ43_ANACO|nr:unnamed protein product [Ananas comosus var. bracteatus]
MILLNGVPGKSFACRRGLRQGDPLSPLLFILCVDVLYRMIHLAATSQSLPAVGIGDVKLHTLQFADDMLLFFDGTTRSAAAIKVILDAFSAYSGLKINYQKSAVVPINLTNSQASALADYLGCSTQAFPFIYLGLPLSPKRLRKADYVPLIEKLDNRLAGWKGLLLSRGGRLVLLNSTLSSVPTFFCSAFALPAWVLKVADKIRGAERVKVHSSSFSSPIDSSSAGELDVNPSKILCHLQPLSPSLYSECFTSSLLPNLSPSPSHVESWSSSVSLSVVGTSEKKGRRRRGRRRRVVEA